MYRQYLEQQVRYHTIRALALKLKSYKPYDPIYSVIKQDIKVLMGLIAH